MRLVLQVSPTTCTTERLLVATNGACALHFIADTSKKNLVRIREGDLSKHDIDILLFLLLGLDNDLPDAPVVSDSVGLLTITGEGNAGKIARLVVDINNPDAIRVSPDAPSADHTVGTAGSEYGIVLRPGDASNAPCVAFEDQIDGIFYGVEPEDVDY